MAEFSSRPAPAPSIVMPGLVPGIQVFDATSKEAVDGRDNLAKTHFALMPGHDELRDSVVGILFAIASPTHQSFTIARYGESWPKARLASACCVAWGGVSVAYRVEFSAAASPRAAGCRRPCRLRADRSGCRRRRGPVRLPVRGIEAAGPPGRAVAGDLLCRSLRHPAERTHPGAPRRRLWTRLLRA